MAFTGNYVCNVFRQGLLRGNFDFATDSFYIALYTGSATLDATTTAYTTVGELVASGYTAGGLLLTAAPLPVTAGATGYVTFANADWVGAFSDVRGALIYKAGDNSAVCVLDFGAAKTSTTTFTVQFPADTATEALIRIK